jgi:alkanesulfonate monooxygenase SsuD/methylene tetrahydromethanopterin reductase-like flavin-dependent oxidoreductase (luciferase family)
VHFGIFDQLDRRAPAEKETLADLYENRLRQIETYDRLGFTHYFVSEHHSTPLGMAPSPGIFLSSVAQRTKRIRFGPLVYTLPLYSPYRLIEEICMLDHLSRGRFQFGVGKGISPFEVGYFGVDHAEAQDRYIEAFEVLKKGLTQPVLDHAGKYYRFTDVPMEFQTLQKPYPPVWYGMVNPVTVDWAAPNDINVVCHVLTPQMGEIIEAYRARWAESHPGADPATRPYTALGRHVVVADTDAEAERLARRAYRVWFDALQFLWRRHGTITKAYPERFEDILAEERIIFGAPATVREQVAEQIKVSRTDLFIVRLMFGDMTDTEALHSIELFASEVMDKLGGGGRAEHSAAAAQ